MSINVSPDTGFSYLFNNVNDNIYKKSKNPLVFAILVTIVIIYVVIFNYLGISHTPSNSNKLGMSSYGIELVLWAVFIFLIFVNALQYFFEIDFRASIKNMFGDNPEIQLDVMEKKGFEKSKQDEVFHIGDNVYTYEEAKVLCKAHDGELASYKQIEKAYNKGAEWCSYGWSKDQMALYPTQQKTYNALKKNPKSKNNCGRPGINGGYIKNPNAKFGVNCYATKNKPSDTERQLMKSQQIVPSIPYSKENEKLDFYKRNINKIVKKPFNSEKWSNF